MSVAVLYSRGLTGLDAPLVTVEVHLAGGLPAFNLVGLPETEVKESRDRVRAAIQNTQFDFPARKITVNLAPADLPKESGRFDLPIALGILVATGQLPTRDLRQYEFAGELALTGELRPIRGALAMAYQAYGDGRAFILPKVSAHEAALVKGATVLPAEHLLQVCAHLTGRAPLARYSHQHEPSAVLYPDLSEVKGQVQAKRALEIAAAGQHSLLMVGPPGTGKSMLATRLPGILPPMSEQEALTTAAIQSLNGSFRLENFRRRPYRSPHHSASAVALVGGGSDPKPGEISLAHHGVLFLDEFPEFERRVLEVLREPLEAGRIAISRAARQVEFPAHFQLIAAMNPCPCGYLGHPNGKCRCSPEQIARYRGKISGPLLDRLDLQIEVPSVPLQDLQSTEAGEHSEVVRERVNQAYQVQLSRQGKPNSQLSADEVTHQFKLDDPAESLLRQAMTKFNLSARAYHRILKVARTIADLKGAKDSKGLNAAHLAEAIGYRRMDSP